MQYQAPAMITISPAHLDLPVSLELHIGARPPFPEGVTYLSSGSLAGFFGLTEPPLHLFPRIGQA